MSTINTAYNSVTDSCCALVVQAIDTMQSQANIVKPAGVLGALNSPINKGTFSLVLDSNKDRPTTGSFRQVITKDIKPVCDQDTTPDDVCTVPAFGASGATGAYVYAEHQINMGIKREILMDLDEFKKFCLTPQQYIIDRTLALRAGVIEEINKKVTEASIVYMGLYAGQEAPDNSISLPKEVNLFSTPTQGFSGYSLIKDEYGKLGYSMANPIVVGGSTMQVFTDSSSRAIGFNQAGYAPDMIPNAFVDYGIDAIMQGGVNHLLTWMPGTLQLVNYNDITLDMARLSVPNVRERARVRDPFNIGWDVDWDFKFDVDATGCKYVITYSTWFDVIVPVPYDNECVKKPVLHFVSGCNANACPDSSVA